MKRFLSYLTLPALLVMPMVAAAQFGEVDTFIKDFSGFINDTLIPVILAIAFLVFVYGAIKFFFWDTGDDYDSNKEKGKKLMLYGVAGFVLIVSIWGIVGLIAGGLNLKQDSLEGKTPEPPAFNNTGGGSGTGASA